MQPLHLLRKTPIFRQLSRFPVTVPVKWKETRYVIYVDLFRNLQFVIRRKWSEPSFAFLVDCFRPRIFWDVGANIGLYSLLFLSRNSRGTILAFEPDKRNVDLLTRTTRRIALSMKIVPKAVDQQSGETAFFIDDLTGATGTIIPSHIFISSQYGVTAILQTKVNTTTLDEQIHENNGPDLIKIDVEGADLAVLEGGRHMLERYLPIVFYEATAANVNQTRRLLERLGYKLFNAETLQAFDDTYAYDLVALHREKHLDRQGHPKPI